jgi:HEAT repeat protein
LRKVTSPDRSAFSETKAMNDETIDRIDAIPRHHGDERTIAEVSPTLVPLSSEEEFEDAYQRIGWWRGPNTTPEARALVRDYWRLQGNRGLSWLVGRLRREWHIDLLDGVASLLAQAGGAGLLPILDELERQPRRDHAEALLKALGWIGEEGIPVQPSSVKRLEMVLSMFLHHDDAGLREGAARAARLLPPEQAMALLGRHVDEEPDADVRQAIEETLASREIGRA